MIKKLNLAGTWDFAMDPEKKGIDEHIYSKEFSDNIPLPGTISMAQKGTPSDVKETGFLTDPYLFEGYAWYAKEIDLDQTDLDKNIILYLERTRMTKVWVDDQLVGDFDSLNTPHEYDLTPYLKQTHFRLTILVSNVDYPTKGGHLTSPDTQTNWNGIIGEIALHIFDQCYIKNVKTFPDTKTRTVRVTFDTVNTTKEEHELTLQTQAFLTDISGDTGISSAAATQEVTFPVGTHANEITYALGSGCCFLE